ncbi:helix-turn-helix transcriptional regulator [Paenibacillus polysaccharolyticus]|uniref:helix-turn-helix transcriptional regulator n=1 Tax=Paenibacillus polysaccharolyticus TaxID=582692 RepID=UPI00280B7D77|nr:AraC family transcriptional regulator [Paenibacillus polysaccharolyticus]
MEHITLSSYGIEYILPGVDFSLSTTNQSILLITTSQTTIISKNGIERELSGGCILIDQNFTLKNTNNSPVEIHKISFSHSIPLTEDSPLIIHLPSKIQIVLKRIFTDLSHSQVIKHLFNEIEKEIEYLLISKLQNPHTCHFETPATQQESQKKIDKRLIVVHRYIRKHFAEPLTLQILADLIECNPVYLSNSFSKIFDVSPMKYLQQVRMQRACTLLKESSMNIKELTTVIGYISNSQFSSIFKKYFSCTPAEYRRNAHTKLYETEPVTR